MDLGVVEEEIFVVTRSSKYIKYLRAQIVGGPLAPLELYCKDPIVLRPSKPIIPHIRGFHHWLFYSDAGLQPSYGWRLAGCCPQAGLFDRNFRICRNSRESPHKQ